ncbi:alpha/beta hydrolase [Sinomicrobium soli]|nr:alpha/beta hydrolase [Sinomicrobium sp. N-1-3-6]
MFFLLVFNMFSYAQSDYKTASDIAYYGNSVEKDTYTEQQCRLDLYYPAGGEKFPTVIWFHGGGLTAGHREIPEALKNSGIAVAGAGYRLSPKVRSEQCIEDAAAAITWVFEHIEAYGGDPDLVFVSGHSAGGYLALMAILDKHYLSSHGIDANDIAGIIPFSGQVITHFNIRKENGIKDTQPVIDRMAPLWHVRADAPPVLLITGDREKEMLGRYEENAYMARMMKIAGHEHTTLYEMDGYGHNMVYPAFPLLVDEVKKQAARIAKDK